jgi:hypothetical protein
MTTNKNWNQAKLVGIIAIFLLVLYVIFEQLYNSHPVLFWVITVTLVVGIIFIFFWNAIRIFFLKIIYKTPKSNPKSNHIADNPYPHKNNKGQGKDNH